MDGNHGRRLPSTIEDELCHDPDVEFVVVFGSRMEGSSRASSDFDVAVKFTDELSSADRFRKHCRLASEVQETDTPFVDLSDVETLPLPVAYAAVNGTFVCGDEEVFETVRETITSKFEDERPAIEREQRELIQRIAEDGLHG